MMTVLALAVRAVLACAIVAFFVQQSFYDHAADFKTFFSAGYAVRHPEIPLYDLVALDDNPFGEVFKLAPPAAVYLVPFSFGTIQEARLAWRVALVAAFVAAYAIVARTVGLRPLGWAWLAGLAGWSVFGPLQIAVGEGQWDPIFLLLIALATRAIWTGRSTVGGVAVAVAASIKPYPFLLIGYFVARRAWRAAAVTAATLAALLVLGALAVGLDETTAFVTRVLPASGATTAYADNQSLGGVLARLLSSDLKPFPLHDSVVVDAAIRVLALALVVATIWLVARRSASEGRERALQLGLFVPLSILVIPAAWTHYEAILLVPLTLLAVDQARHRPRAALGWLLLAVAYAVLLLPNPTMVYGPEIDRGLWLRSRADAASLALQRLYPTALSRLILSYKAFAVILLYGLLAWRVAHGSTRGAEHGVSASKPAAPVGLAS
jgi:alpha-1,2-mannosyltransferase